MKKGKGTSEESYRRKENTRRSEIKKNCRKRGQNKKKRRSEIKTNFGKRGKNKKTKKNKEEKNVEK